MGSPVAPDSIGSSPKWKTYTLGAGDIAVETDGGGPCRGIWVDTDCTLRLYPATGGASDDTKFVATTRHDVQVKKIGGTGDGSTPAGTKIVVFW